MLRPKVPLLRETGRRLKNRNHNEIDHLATMSEESKSIRLRKTRDGLLAQSEDIGALFPDSRPGSQRPKDNFFGNIPTRASVYLWLCCEGWMKFGPFEWLRFDDERHAILGQDGEEVGQWRVPGEKWQDWRFSNPTITWSPVHPHKKSERHPQPRSHLHRP